MQFKRNSDAQRNSNAVGLLCVVAAGAGGLRHKDLRGTHYLQKEGGFDQQPDQSTEFNRYLIAWWSGELYLSLIVN